VNPARPHPTRVTTAPACGTPWSRPPTTPATPTSHPRPTPPQTHTTPARLLVTIDHDTPTNSLTAEGIATTTADGIDLPPGVVRRLACDAEIIPAVLGSHGEVLDVGRLKPLVTAVIWIALVIRDRHCTFPDCTRPPIMCHAHHIRHWLNGEKTCLDNLALLCGHHHRIIHHTPWEIRLKKTDRKPEFQPPPKRTEQSQDNDNRIRHRPRQE
jgi:hypothetical protein